MSFDPEYKAALDRDQAVDLLAEFKKERFRFVDMAVLYVPGNATIRTNPNPTSTSDFAILDFYVNGTGYHVTTTLPATDYTQLLSDSTPNELQTRHFLTPERQADVGCIRVITSQTSIGEIIDIDFTLEIVSPRHQSASPGKPLRLNFAIDGHTAQVCAPIALRTVFKRRFTVPDSTNPKNVWFVDFLSAAKKFDLRHLYFVIAGRIQGDGPLPDILKSSELHAVNAGDSRFDPMRLAEPAHANHLYDEIAAARDASARNQR